MLILLVEYFNVDCLYLSLNCLQDFRVTTCFQTFLYSTPRCLIFKLLKNEGGNLNPPFCLVLPIFFQKPINMLKSYLRKIYQRKCQLDIFCHPAQSYRFRCHEPKSMELIPQYNFHTQTMF